MRIGIHWTAVCVEDGNTRKCGLASTLLAGHEHTGIPDIPEAGQLQKQPGKELANFCLDPSHPTLCSLGMAALNALLPVNVEPVLGVNAEDLMGGLGDQNVVLVGHFPFVKRLRQKLTNLAVLELDPGPGDFPADYAPEIIPAADFIAITGMAFLNNTLESLLKLRNPAATVMVLGPTTPLDGRLYNYGIDILSGALVRDIPAVLDAVSQGGNFRQVHHAGLELATSFRPGLDFHYG